MSSFAGRLVNFKPAWQKLTGDKTILQTVKGYKIPFLNSPKQIKVPSEPIIKGNEIHHYQKAIDSLLEKGAIRPCNYEEGQFISSYFLVDKPNGDKRFILNLKKLNEFLKPEHFKMENIKTVLSLMSKDCYMTNIDLHDAYFLIPVDKKHRKFLRFIFQGQIFEFICIAFGLCTAPQVFTKLMKPVAQELRLKGIICVFYLDDLLILSNKFEDCKKNTELAIVLLESLGFLINFKKSNVMPTQNQKFLGFILNSQEFCLELPSEKKQKIFNLVSDFMNKERCRIRDLAQLAGILVAACPAVKYGWRHTKELERQKYLALKQSQNNYDKKITVPVELNPDLVWWKNHVLLVKNPIRRHKFQLEIFTDASKTGWGAHCKGENTNGWWSRDERKEHINCLELKAALAGLKCFARDYHSCNVLLRIDNTTAIALINKMGGVRYPKLNKVCNQIWDWCEANDIWIFASYIKSKDNIEADKQSRLLPTETEWELAPWAFELIIKEFGNFTIDLFASEANAKCSRFISWKKDPASEAVDAFTVSWSQEFFYAFPPFSMILKTLQKIITDKAKGVLVVPYWPTQAWYPLFGQLLVGDPIKFKPKSDLLRCPFRETHPLSSSLTMIAGQLYGGLF